MDSTHLFGGAMSQLTFSMQDLNYKARTRDIQLNNSELNTLKWKMHMQLAAKMASQNCSWDQLSAADHLDILTQLHLSLEHHQCSIALNNAGFDVAFPDSLTPQLHATKKIEALIAFLGVNGVHLMRMDLSEAKMNNADLQRAYLSESNLRGTDLDDANLEGAQLRHADLRGATLRGTNLLRANLLGANLHGAILDEHTKITLQLPEQWTTDLVGSQLNHLANGRSWLTTIESIDDHHATLKVRLIHQIIDSLETQNTNTSTVNQALLAVLTANPIYTLDEKINLFITRISG